MSSPRKKILIAGGTGFIGRNLVNWFRSKPEFEVTATHWTRTPPPNIEGVTWIKVDLRRPEDVKTALNNQDILIQAAATTSGVKDIVFSPAIHVTDNAVMNSYLFRQAVENKMDHVLFFSCSVMYPPFSEGLVEEGAAGNYQLHDRYFGVGWTKIYCERMCEFFAKNSKTKFTALRHSNIYGSFDKYDLEKSHMFGASVTKVLSADKEVVVWGDGKEERDLLFVNDLMEAVELSLKNQPTAFGLYNIGGGRGHTVTDIVSKLIQASGKSLKISYDSSKPSIKTRIVLDCKKAKQELNWVQKTNLDDGILKTLSWLKENPQGQGE